MEVTISSDSTVILSTNTSFLYKSEISENPFTRTKLEDEPPTQDMTRLITPDMLTSLTHDMAIIKETFPRSAITVV